ncbi:hypothetical protein JCM10213_002006 [Rhodosporidiobolus nylandii]
MSSRAEVVKQTLESRYSVSLSWDLKLDIETFGGVGQVLPAATNPPLAGDWEIELHKPTGGDTLLIIDFRHGVGVQAGRYGIADAKCRFFWLDDQGEAYEITAGVWLKAPLPEVNEPIGRAYTGWSVDLKQLSLDRAQATSGGAFNPKTHRDYRCTVEIRKDMATPAAPIFPKPGALVAARKIAATSLLHAPHDVRIFFPSIGTDGAELWASSALLSSASPYLKDLLSSDFAEAQPRRSKRARTGGAVEVQAPEQAPKDFEDSDDETDRYLLATKPPSLSSSSETDDLSYLQITVTQAAFSTYHAVLVYLQTGFIHFAPLSSSFASSATSTRRDFLSSKHAKNPSLPLPVSPKSAYRLAHLLGVRDLQRHCLTAISTSLKPEMVAAELFGETASCYDAIRGALIDYAVENWLAVRNSAEWRKITRKMKGEEVPGATAILLEIMEAQAHQNWFAAQEEEEEYE